jgi:hypothetical protein
MKQYYLTLGCMFKNECSVLYEYLLHYIYHGVEHFFMINDDSSDNYIEILQPFIDKNIVTLINCDQPPIFDRQTVIYTNYLIPFLEKTQWMIVADLDEFVYSPVNIDLKYILKQYEHYGVVYLNWSFFGSSKQVKQPKNIVDTFIQRQHVYQYPLLIDTNKHPLMLNFSDGGWPNKPEKYIVNSNNNFTKLGVHHIEGSDINSINISWRSSNQREQLISNHYFTQSFEYFAQKKIRKNADPTLHTTHTMDSFFNFDFDDVEDYRLCLQNKPLLNQNFCDNLIDKLYNKNKKNFLQIYIENSTKLNSICNLPKIIYVEIYPNYINDILFSLLDNKTIISYLIAKKSDLYKIYNDIKNFCFYRTPENININNLKIYETDDYKSVKFNKKINILRITQNHNELAKLLIHFMSFLSKISILIIQNNENINDILLECRFNIVYHKKFSLIDVFVVEM